MNDGHEIERRFLVPDPPSELGTSTTIEQLYIAIDDLGDTSTTVRIRRRDDICTLTVKGGAGLVRTEVEIEVTDIDFTRLSTFAAGRRIDKRRHLLALDDALTAEVDVFSGPCEGIVIVEVEFPDERAAGRFIPPEWFGDEVTDIEGWSNVELAVHGPPTSTV
jgi:CYTH domain-containing protein